MSNSDEYMRQIKKIFRRWFKHIAYVFTAIIIVFFNLHFGNIVRDNINSFKNQDYISVLKAFKFGLQECIKPIAFLVIPVLLCLAVYTNYVIIRMLKRSSKLDFNWSNFVSYFILVLSNCIFSGLICFIGNIWLDYKISILFFMFIIFCVFILLIFLVMHSRLLIKERKLPPKYISLIIVALMVTLFILNIHWIYITVAPIIRYFLDPSNSYRTLSKFSLWYKSISGWLIFILLFLFAVRRIYFKIYQYLTHD